MKNVLKWVMITVGSLVAIFLVGGFMIPSTWSVSESTVINASAESVYAQIADLKNWQGWSVWTKEKDPNQEYTYEGSELGVGQKWSWASDKMGKGYLEIKSADPTKGINYELFLDMNGNQSTMHGEIAYVETEAGLEITWTDKGDAGNNLVKRWMTLFIKSMLSDDFKTGLSKLKTIVEAPAPSAEPTQQDAPAVQGEPAQGSAPATQEPAQEPAVAPAN